MAVAFLPVFYGHLALNDVPTLAPRRVSVAVGHGGVLRRGWALDYAIAGVGLGLACATKYTGGIVLLPLLAAAAQLAVRRGAGGARAPARPGAGAVAAAAFVVANPYAILDFDAFSDGSQHQATRRATSLGKLGLEHENGCSYYLWTLTWGLGWVPLGGAWAGAGARRDRGALAAVLVPGPLVFIAFMGAQERFFGRWLLPVFPIAVPAGRVRVVRLVELAGAAAAGAAPGAGALGARAAAPRGSSTACTSDRVLSRDDTRNLGREPGWWTTCRPARRSWSSRSSPTRGSTDVGAHPLAGDGQRRALGQVPDEPLEHRQRRLADPGRKGAVVNIEDYERTLGPALVDRYEAEGYCCVVIGSTQRGRAEADPEEVPRAIAYYRELERRADLVFQRRPLPAGAGRSRSTSTGASTTTRSPTSGRGPCGLPAAGWRLRGG